MRGLRVGGLAGGVVWGRVAVPWFEGLPWAGVTLRVGGWRVGGSRGGGGWRPAGRRLGVWRRSWRSGQGLDACGCPVVVFRNRLVLYITI